jgi:hypothetical protein
LKVLGPFLAKLYGEENNKVGFSSLILIQIFSSAKQMHAMMMAKYFI